LKAEANVRAFLAVVVFKSVFFWSKGPHTTLNEESGCRAGI
jgi:hypothetical protein